MQLSLRKHNRRTSCFCHNPIFALFSSVAIQREQRKNQEQGNIYKEIFIFRCSLCIATDEKRAKIGLWLKHEVRLLCFFSDNWLVVSTSVV